MAYPEPIKEQGTGRLIYTNPDTGKLYYWDTEAEVKSTGPGPSPSGGGGGGGGSSLSPALREAFKYWFGPDYPRASFKKAARQQWSLDDVRRLAAKWAVNRPDEVQGPGMLIALTVTRQALARAGYEDPSNSEVLSYIKSGIYESSAFEEYLTTLGSFDWTKSSNAGRFRDYWAQMTGTVMSQTALEEVAMQVRELGWQGAWDWFQEWTKSTESAVQGNYGDAKREGISNMIARYLERYATEDELSAEGELWHANEASIMDYIRGTDEYALIYAAKPDDMREEEFLALRDAFDDAYRELYAMRTYVEPTYDEEGNLIFDEEAFVPGMPNDLLAHYLQNDVAPDEIAQQARWLEDAEYLAAEVVPMVEEVFGRTLTDDELYVISSGARGSGDLRAMILEAQNRLKFRAEFRRVVGRDPDPEDYEYLDTHFVDPDEYARVSAAHESAEAKLPELNELVSRVLGKEYTLEQIQNMVAGGAGSGAMQAEIAQAIKLDSYTEPYLAHYGRTPTPDEYAQYAGYYNVAELNRVLQTRERVAEYAPEIQSAFAEGLGYTLTDEQLEIMLGDRAGSGALKAQLQEARKRKEKKETDALSIQRGMQVSVPLATSPTGGLQTTVKPKPML